MSLGTRFTRGSASTAAAAQSGLRDQQDPPEPPARLEARAPPAELGHSGQVDRDLQDLPVHLAQVAAQAALEVPGLLAQLGKQGPLGPAAVQERKEVPV